MSLSIEIVLMWATVLVYAAASVAFIAGGVFVRAGLMRAGTWIAGVGLALHGAGTIVRWVRVGHAPFLGFYEVVSAYAFATVAMLLVVALVRPVFRPLGMVLMPVALLGLGAAMLADKSDELVTGMLASWWLTVHVLFARLAYSSFVVAFALAVAYLIRDRSGGGRLKPFLDKLPSQPVVDELSFRFAAVGLIFLSVMIAAGAIWANESWGRYWGWDAIETWSLVVWLVYALYLHLRLTLGWRDRRSAWVLILALPLMVFSFAVVPILYNSIHAAYMRGF